MAPRSDHLLFELQPAMRKAITRSELVAATYIRAIFKSRTIISGLQGMTTYTRIPDANVSIGANIKAARSAADGIMSSFDNSLIASANVWNNPFGPTRLGPMRCCM